jgi:hypothetical protein
MPLPETVEKLQFGWARDDFPWALIEPQKGQWNWQQTDGLVLRAHAAGVEILPILDYSAPWAGSTPGKKFSPPARVEDWEDFVEHTVARYTQPPYSLRYFQVWNEPTRQAGFWTGSDEEFIDKVYLPAAKIIRSHGGRVVFGGWPSSNSLQEFDRILAYHHAWRWTDILDVHYRGLSAWQHLYDTWVKPGKSLGVWQTEIGFTSNPEYLPNVYLRALYWALRSGWSDPDQYKLFWYASSGGGKDGDKCLTKIAADHTTILTQNGILLSVMNGMLGGGSLTSFSNFSTDPPLHPVLEGTAPTALGFSVGRERVVIALLGRTMFAKQAVLSVTVSTERRPARVELVSLSGVTWALNSDYRGGSLQVNIPLRELLKTSETDGAYLKIDQN